MPKPSYHYTKKLTAGTTQVILTLPRLRNLTIINTGDNEIQIEFENDISTDSIIIPVGSAYEVKSDFLDFRYKSVSGTSDFYIAGLLHEKA